MTDLASIDHLVLAALDLEALGRWWSEQTGTAATPGGAHTGRGTRNQLVGIDATTYIELIGRDPDQPEPRQPRGFDIDDRPGIRFARFAMAVDDLDAVAATIARHGIEPGPVFDMERTRPDGVRLAWRLCVPPDPALAGVMPFFIQWAPDAPHPAADLASVCSLESLSMTHPEASSIAAAVAEATGTTLDIATDAPGLRATLRFGASGDSLTIDSEEISP